MADEELLVVATGCPTCEAIKEGGACTENKCVDVTTTEGNKIANEANVKFVPQKLCRTKDNKWKKCGGTEKIIKKYSKKK